MSETKVHLSQYPVPLDVADIVTALVGMSPEVRNDVLVRVCQELGTDWLWQAGLESESGRVSEK